MNNAKQMAVLTICVLILGALIGVPSFYLLLDTPLESEAPETTYTFEIEGEQETPWGPLPEVVIVRFDGLQFLQQQHIQVGSLPLETELISYNWYGQIEQDGLAWHNYSGGSTHGIPIDFRINLNEVNPELMQYQWIQELRLFNAAESETYSIEFVVQFR